MTKIAIERSTLQAAVDALNRYEHDTGVQDWVVVELRAALAQQTEPDNKVPCSTHPDAPHGFDRTASHSLDRYVCECESWSPSPAVPDEHVRVLREALEDAKVGLGWYIDMHPEDADDSDAAMMAEIDAALEATK